MCQKLRRARSSGKNVATCGSLPFLTDVAHIILISGRMFESDNMSIFFSMFSRRKCIYLKFIV